MCNVYTLIWKSCILFVYFCTLSKKNTLICKSNTIMCKMHYLICTIHLKSLVNVMHTLSSDFEAYGPDLFNLFNWRKYRSTCMCCIF